ncbi:CRAL/TRIO domain-containing protein [Backusella circina FSU 941]|nr:CRAL/TRIO domain-containing protein [Backusella circina FSU 941]
MPVPFPTNLSLENRKPGHAGALTSDQTQALKQLWTRLIPLFDQPGQPIQLPKKQEEKPASGGGFFGFMAKKEEPIPENYYLGATADPRWTNLTLTEALPLIPGEKIKTAFWSLVATDNPDSTLLRFLRARKWDANAAYFMLMNTLRWRIVMRIDEITSLGEEGLVVELEKAHKGLGEAFKKQLELKMVSLSGPDKDARAVCFVNVQVHHKENQPLEVMKLLTIYIMETSRLFCGYPMEAICLVFNLENFTLSNMDFDMVKFLASCFEAYYPETLGLCCVHMAPWVFSTIWSMITPLLDPVVVSKIIFTKSVGQLEQYIDAEGLPMIISGDTSRPCKDERTKCAPLKAGSVQIPKTPNVDVYWTTINQYQKQTLEWAESDKESTLNRLESAQAYRMARIRAESSLRGETSYHGKGLVQLTDDRLILDYGTESWKPTDVTEWV